MLEKTARFSYMLLFLSGMFLLFNVNNAQATPNSSYPKLGCFTWGQGASPAWCAQFDLLVSADASLAVAAKKINPNMYALVTRDWQCADGLSNIPAEWYVRNSQGEKIAIYGSTTYKLVDITDYCPRSAAFGGKRYNEYLTDWMTSVADLNVLDGVASAGVVEYPRSDALKDVDLDRNGVNDWSEHDKAWIQSVWLAGIHTATALLREAIGDDKLISFNSSRLHEFERETTNGVYLEHCEYAGSLTYFRREYADWMAVAPDPHILHYGANRGPEGHPEDFRYMRFHLCHAMSGDAYFEATDAYSSEHHYVHYYDEFDLDLGQPVSDMYKIKDTPNWEGIWLRFFEKGLVIYSPTSDQTTISVSEIQGESYYDGPYYHFLGGEDPETNDGTLFDSFTFRGRSWADGYIGDGLILVNSPNVVAISDIVVDNVFQATSPGSEPVELSGDAYQSNTETSSNWASGARGYRGQYYSAIIPPGVADSKATFKPTINVSGLYEVLEWHGSLATGSEVQSVEAKIGFGDGLEAITSIDQSVNQGQWNSLGSYYFQSSGHNYVELDQSESGEVIADAVKFVYAGAENDVVPPNPPTQLQSRTQTEYTIELTWSPPSAASDGDVAVAYQIFRNGQLVKTTTKNSFLDEDLAESSSYSYEVYSVDDFGHLSTQAAVLQASTLADVIPPSFISVISRSATELELVFSENLEQSSVVTLGNYSITNDISVTSATLLENQSRVKLLTSEHEIATSYQIQVSGIKDASKAHNAMIVPKTITYEGATGDSILIKVSADNAYDLYVNGIFIGSDEAWSVGQQYWVPCAAGENVIAIKATDLGGQGGLVAEIEYKGQHLVSNSTIWKVNEEEKNGWETIAYDDSNWSYATSYGAHGTALPWAQYKNVADISTEDGVQWIWSDNYELDDIVYFRLTLNPDGDTEPPDTPSGFTEAVQTK